MNETDALLHGCEAIGIPEETANELLKLLLIKTSVGRKKSQDYGQSQVSFIDKIVDSWGLDRSPYF